MRLDDLLEKLLNRDIEVSALGELSLEIARYVIKSFREDRVDDHHRTRDRLLGPRGAEFKPISSEGERAGPIPIPRIGRQDRQRVDTYRQVPLLLRARRASLCDLIEHVGQLVSQKD
jgi:hypothetical protein